MKPPTQALVQTLLLLLVVGQIAQEVIAFHSGYKNHHHELHHQGHHEGHHHSSSLHHGHHGARAARIRREKEAKGTSSQDKDSETSLPGINSILCNVQEECSGVTRSKCNIEKKFCDCPVEYPTYDPFNDVCVTESKLTEKCEYAIECEQSDEYSLCGPDKTCICEDGYNLEDFPDVGNKCVRRNPNTQGPVDPAMIGVLVGLALMFVIICVVLRLFSKARFRENRSIFNTPNPRLMNASLFKDRRRGSAMSAVSATGSAAHSGGAAKTPSPAKEPKAKSETTVAIENVD